MNRPRPDGAGAGGDNLTRSSPSSLPPAHDRRRGGTKAARSIFPDLHIWLRATPQQRRIWAHAATVAGQTVAYQRRLILAHPDLAAKVATLYRLERPDQWTGYIPPATNEHGQPNRSPYRQVLVELVAEAARREAGGG